MMHAIPADRRPAIWPWFVMPLIALTLFYCLDTLKKAQDQKDYEGSAPTPTAAAQVQSDPETH